MTGKSERQAFLLPARLVDEVLPTLTDTELRVLLVVLRQTVGRGKERDWLARSQIVARTGRSPDAVSRAVDSLSQNGLILVEEESGSPCVTPKARRAVQSRLYFRPGKTLESTAVVSNVDNLPVNLRVTQDDTTESNKKLPVVAYDKTRSGTPLWLQQPGQHPTTEEAERIEREKRKIRETLQTRQSE